VIINHLNNIIIMDTVTVIIDSCRMYAAQLAPNMKSCGECTNVATSCCDCTSSCGNATWITLIICLTILLLGLALFILLCYLKRKQIKLKKEEKEKELANASTLKDQELEIKKYEEMKLYRSMLVNFLESRAKEDKRESGKVQANENEYIKELKSLINDLNPTQEKPENKDGE